MSRVAVVIPAHKAESFIERSVRSAMEQCPPPDDVVVACDGCVDRTAELARACGATVLELPKANANVARNAGVRHTDAEILFLLDADDWYMEGKIARHLKEHESGSHAMVMDPGTWISPEGVEHGLSGPGLGASLNYGAFTSRRYWYGGSTFSVRREAFERIGGFREELTSQQDLDFWIRFTHANGPALVLERSYTHYYMNPWSLSRNPAGVVANMRRLLAGLPFLSFREKRRFWSHVMFNTADQLPFPRSIPFLARALDRAWDPRFAKAVARSIRRMAAGGGR